MFFRKVHHALAAIALAFFITPFFWVKDDTDLPLGNIFHVIGAVVAIAAVVLAVVSWYRKRKKP